MDKFREAREERRDTSPLYFNIAYYLADKAFIKASKRSIDVDDILLIVDNLEINNEIIDEDTINDYNLNKIGITKREEKQIREGRKILLLNYYSFREIKLPEGRLIDATTLQHCHIMLDNTNYYNF